MFSSSALETMNSASPELKWKTFTKGRRSRKSVARSFDSPKRVMDYMSCGSNQVEGSGHGHSTSRRTEKVPIKKRRHLDQLPLLQPQILYAFHRDSSSMKLDPSSAFSGENEQPMYPSCSSEDFSGIELLAAAASMDDDFLNAGFEDLTEKSFSPMCSDAAAFTPQSKELPKLNELGTSTCDKTLVGGNSGSALVLPESVASSETLCRSPKKNDMHKVNRQHWDLNIVMDAWVEPFDSNVNCLPSEDKQKDPEDQLLLNPVGKTDEFSGPRTKDNESAVNLDRIFCQLPYRKEHMQSSYNATGDCSDQFTRNDVDEWNKNQVLGCDSDLEASKQVKMTEAAIDRYLAPKLDCLSGMLMQEEKLITHAGTTAEPQDEVFSGKTLVFDRAHTSTPDVTVRDLPKVEEVSESMKGVQCNDIKDAGMTSGVPHITNSVEKAMPCASKPTQIPKPVHNAGTTVGVKEIIMSCARAQCADPSVSVEKNDLAVHVPHYDQRHMVIDDVIRHEEGYDSSYEDGELRGSFLYSWEDNAGENRSVDCEFDGKNGDGPSADDYAGYEMLEGGSERYHGSETRNLNENESVARSIRHFVNDGPENKEVSGKGESNAGSCTTVEHLLEMIIEENADCPKRRQLSDMRDLVVGKSRDTDEYQLKFTAKQSSIDSHDRWNTYSMQRSRSLRFDRSFSRTEREVAPGRYHGRRRPTSYNERDGVDQWTHWASKKHFASRYQGAESRGYIRPRSTISNSAEFNRFDENDLGQTANNLSMRSNKPFMRKSSLGNDCSLGIRRKKIFVEETSTYKRREFYSERAGRDFGEHFDCPPENVARRVTRLTRYSSKRERSLSPSSGAIDTYRRRPISRSRTPPRVWQSRRDRNLCAMKHSKSQDFGYEVRTPPRVRTSFAESAFASEYEDNYSSPLRRRFSSHRRWADDRGPNNNVKLRRSPIRDLRGSRSKDRHYPPGRFYFKPNSGREAKFGTSGCDDNGDVNHRDNGGDVRRLRAANSARDFDTSGLNNDDSYDADADVQVHNTCDLPPIRTEKGDEHV